MARAFAVLRERRVLARVSNLCPHAVVSRSGPSGLSIRIATFFCWPCWFPRGSVTDSYAHSLQPNGCLSQDTHTLTHSLSHTSHTRTYTHTHVHPHTCVDHGAKCAPKCAPSSVTDSQSWASGDPTVHTQCSTHRAHTHTHTRARTHTHARTHAHMHVTFYKISAKRANALT